MRRALPDRLHRETGGVRIPSRRRSKTWGPLTGHGERAFKRQPHFTNQSVVEQTTENGNTVRHAARRVELWQRVGWIGRPIAASFRNLDKTRAQRKRRMSGKVRDRKLLIAQRGHQQNIHVVKDTRHLERHFAPQPIGLYEINRRKKSGLAKEIGPGVFHLYLQFSQLIVKRQVFE